MDKIIKGLYKRRLYYKSLPIYCKLQKTIQKHLKRRVNIGYNDIIRDQLTEL